MPILRFSFSQPNMRSMMLRCRYFGDRIALVILAWAYVSWFAVESQAAFGNGRSTGAIARHRSPCLPATIGNACGAGLACRGRVPAPGVPEHSRYRWPDPVSVESAEVCRWRRRSGGSWWSGRLGYVPTHGLPALLAPLFPGSRRSSGCSHCC